MEETPDWLSAEHLVSWLEHYISPGARIDHNVHLPVIGQERTRQCDVVIRTGSPPRDQLWIVEVQKRRSKPDINTFQGWVRKMEEVGAHGLICVSHKGFPSSVIEDVSRRLGPRVRLLTINQEGQPDFSWNDLKITDPVVEYVNFKIRAEALYLPYFPGPCRPPFGLVCENTPSVSVAGRIEDSRPLGVILNEILHAADPFLSLPPEEIALPQHIVINLGEVLGGLAWLHCDGWSMPFVSWEIPMVVEREFVLKTLTHTKWSYAQEMHNGAAAWFARASGEIEGIETEMTTIFVPNEEGLLTVGNVVLVKPTSKISGFRLTTTQGK